MLKNTILLIILYFLVFNINCYSPNDFKCFAESEKVKVGDEVVLCIHLMQSDKKIGIPIKVDEYSVVRVEGVKDEYDDLDNEEKYEYEILAQINDTTSVFTSVRINFLISSISNYYYSIIIILITYIQCLI